MNIVVIGGGAWGTAMALRAVRNARDCDQVSLWVRDATQAQQWRACRENRRYLPGVVLPPTLDIRAADDGNCEVLTESDLILIATPMSGLRGWLTRLRATRAVVAWLCKGFEAPDDGVTGGALGHEILEQVAPDLRAGMLSGPSFAQEVAAERPTALVAASPHAQVRECLVRTFHCPVLRVYGNEDLIGVEVGGAVKNVLAIATGLCDGLALGLNARAALITRGLAEMTRLGLALGARAETFMGLSGMGDLVLTATGDLSRNRRVGLALAREQTLEQIMAELGHVAEGVYSAHTVVRRAQALGVDMPIASAVLALLEGQLQPKSAVLALMGRDPTLEMRA